MNQVNYEKRISAITAHISTCANLSKERIYIPLINRMDGFNSLQKALHWTFERSQVWMLTMEKLGPLDFQALCTGCRTILENLLDLEAIRRFPAEVDKWHRFHFMSRFRQSEKLKKLVTDNPDTKDLVPKNGVTFSEEKKHKEQYKKWSAAWGKTVPKNHWRHNTIADLAVALGPSFEAKYRSAYYYLSRVTHSGPLPEFVTTPQDVADIFIYASLRSSEYFSDSIEIIEASFRDLLETKGLGIELADARKVLDERMMKRTKGGIFLPRSDWL